MRLAVMFVALLLTVLVVGCDASGSSGPPSTSRSSEPPAALLPTPSASEIPSSATTTPPRAEPPTPERPPPVHVAPRTLATSWQSYLGERVQLRCRPVRRIDFTRTLVVAGGERFVITGPPDVTPCETTTSTFTVMGSTAVPIAGRTVLPELLLEDDGGGENRSR